MSIAEIERSNAALRAEAEKASQWRSADGVTDFATAKGYSFTASELTEHVRAKAEAAGKQVTDAELDSVAGGYDNPFTNFRPY
jgi:hypothetical protein